MIRFLRLLLDETSNYWQLLLLQIVLRLQAFRMHQPLLLAFLQFFTC